MQPAVAQINSDYDDLNQELSDPFLRQGVSASEIANYRAQSDIDRAQDITDRRNLQIATEMTTPSSQTTSFRNATNNSKDVKSKK